MNPNEIFVKLLASVMEKEPLLSIGFKHENIFHPGQFHSRTSIRTTSSAPRRHQTNDKAQRHRSDRQDVLLMTAHEDIQ